MASHQKSHCIWNSLWFGSVLPFRSPVCLPYILHLIHTWTLYFHVSMPLRTLSFILEGSSVPVKFLFSLVWCKNFCPWSQSQIILLILPAASLVPPFIPLFSMAFVLSLKNAAFLKNYPWYLGGKKFILPTLYVLGKVLNLKFMTSLWLSGGCGKVKHFVKLHG